MLKQSTKTHRTNILPLRWISNYLGEWGSNFLVKAMYLDEDGDYGFKYKVYSTIWKATDFFSSRWGTYYTLNIKSWQEELKGEGWDDYDSDGLPYWENFWNEDPVTGDAWRLFRK